MSQIRCFTDLKVWAKAHQLVLEIYEITKNFPAEEKYALSQQLRRAAVSIGSNIVEGFKKHSKKDSLHFYNISAASLEEAKYQLLIARDLTYIEQIKYTNIIKLCNEVGIMLNAWINSNRQRYLKS